MDCFVAMKAPRKDEVRFQAKTKVKNYVILASEIPLISYNYYFTLYIVI